MWTKKNAKEEVVVGEITPRTMGNLSASSLPTSVPIVLCTGQRQVLAMKLC